MKKKRKQGKGKKLIQIHIWKVTFDLFLCFVALTMSSVVFYKFVNPSTTPLMWIRWMESGTPQNLPRYLNAWIPIEEFSQNIVKAVLAAEDQKFFFT